MCEANSNCILKSINYNLVSDFKMPPPWNFHILLQPGKHRLNTFPYKVKRNNYSRISNFSFQFIIPIVSVIWSNSTTINHTKAICWSSTPNPLPRKMVVNPHTKRKHKIRWCSFISVVQRKGGQHDTVKQTKWRLPFLYFKSHCRWWIWASDIVDMEGIMRRI